MNKIKLDLKKEFTKVDSIYNSLINDIDGCHKLSRLLKLKTGINLPVDNEKNLVLFASRLISLFKKLNVNSYEDYLGLLFDENYSDLRMSEFISHITTNTTEFFRERNHFEKLNKILSEITNKRNNEVRIWCCATSTGQEVYSILISILEFFTQNNIKKEIKFLATDIDIEVLNKALKAKYSELEVDNVPTVIKNKYFYKEKLINGKFIYSIKNEYKEKIKFAVFNLANFDEYKFVYKFDIIFCRNVLIYFEHETAEKVINYLIDCLAKDSYLFLGHSESGLLNSKKIIKLNNSVFRRKE